MNQMAQQRGLGQSTQLGFQHLQHQMQPSQLPQQPPMGGGMMQHPPNQRPFGMPVAQNRGPGGMMGDENKARVLTQQERQQLTENSSKLYAGLTDAQKAILRNRLQQTMAPQSLASYASMGRDLAMVFLEQQQMQNFFLNPQNQQRLQQQQTQPNALQQTPQLGQMGHMPTMMNTPTPQQQMTAGQLFPQNMGQMRSQQDMMRAQQMEAGGRNPTPSPINGLVGQVPPNGQPGLGAIPRSQQQFMQQPVKMDPTVPQMAQGVNRPGMPGQPGGLVGVPPASQGPTPLNRLTSAMSQPPVAMGQNGPGVQQMTGPLNPNFANTPNQRQTGNPAFANFYAGLPDDFKQGLSDQQLREMHANYTARSSLQNQKMPQAPSMMGTIGQTQPGIMAPFPMGSQPQQPGVGAPLNAQAAMVEKQRQQMILAFQNPKIRATMESMDVPPQILEQYRQFITPDVRKWGEFKAHLQSSGVPPAKGFPHYQMRQYLELQSRSTQPGGPQNANPQNPPGPPQAAPVPRLPAHVEIPPVTQQDIDEVRQRVPNGMQYSEEDVVRIATKFKQDKFTKMWRQQNANAMNPGLGEQKPPVPTSAPSMAQAPAAPMPSVAQPRQSAPQKSAASAEPDSSAPPSATLKDARPPLQNRTAPNPSPAPPPRNLKRSSPDDADDLPEQPTQVVAPPARPPPRTRQPLTALTADQVAALNPEQRAKYEQLRQDQMHAQALNSIAGTATPDDYLALRKMANEEKAMHDQERQNPTQAIIPMSPEDMNDVREKISQALNKMNRLNRHHATIALFISTEDKAAIRCYLFRSRFRLLRQYTNDTDYVWKKDGLTISKSEVDQLHLGLDKLLSAVNQLVQSARKPQALGGEAMGQSTPQQAPQPTPVVVDKQAPKPQTSRPVPKGVQAPAAPTTSHPPFGLRAHQSPAGEPQYFNKPPITQMNLQPPPPRKKAKTAPSPSVPQMGAGISPKPKVPSPDMRRQQQPVPEPPKPQPETYPCSFVDCEMHNVGFMTEDARDAHVQEVHVRPFENAPNYLTESMAFFLDMDGDDGVPTAPAMGASLSRQGQTPGMKEATPMSRGASMGRQGSAGGGQAGRAATPAAKEANETTWASTIDPQTLRNTFAPMDTLNGSMLVDYGSYRPGTETPNDTPSGASEPNSDITEGTTLDMDLSCWQPLNPDILADVSNMDMEHYDRLASPIHFPDMDFAPMDFSKPPQLQLDPMMYSMDPS
ncbi:hypothetical protein QBC39DRAFT_341796 [Podospora conica]|nr:hypothetical protein QBC39DRAFT_341796 [Schizothecium conicum]